MEVPLEIEVMALVKLVDDEIPVAVVVVNVLEVAVDTPVV